LPVSGVQVQAHLVWKGELPGDNRGVSAQKYPKVNILEKEKNAGHYIGYLIAPEYEGYYGVNIIVTATDRPSFC